MSSRKLWPIFNTARAARTRDAGVVNTGAGVRAGLRLPDELLGEVIGYALRPKPSAQGYESSTDPDPLFFLLRRVSRVFLAFAHELHPNGTNKVADAAAAVVLDNITLMRKRGQHAMQSSMALLCTAFAEVTRLSMIRRNAPRWDHDAALSSIAREEALDNYDAEMEYVYLDPEWISAANVILSSCPKLIELTVDTAWDSMSLEGLQVGLARSVQDCGIEVLRQGQVSRVAFGSSDTMEHLAIRVASKHPLDASLQLTLPASLRSMSLNNTNLAHPASLRNQLAHVTRLTSLSIDQLQHTEVEMVEELLSALPSLYQLIVTSCQDLVSTDQLRKTLNSFDLESLWLDLCPVADIAALHLESNTTLSDLSLMCSAIQDPGVFELEHNRTLLSLSLHHAPFRSFDFRLESNSTLVVLDLFGVEADLAKCRALAEQLRLNTTLEHLNLGYCGLDDELVAAVSASGIGALEELNLVHNDISDEGLEVLNTNIGCNPSLKKLVVSGNPLTDAGVAKVRADGRAVGFVCGPIDDL